MPRTKMHRKKSSVKKRLGQSMMSVNSGSSDSLASSTPLSNRTEELNAFLSKRYESPDHLLKEFELFYEKMVETRRRGYETAREHVQKMFKALAGNLPESYINLTVNSQYNESLFGDENKDLNGTAARQSRIRKLDSSTFDDFKKPKTPRTNQHSSRKRSVSVPTPEMPPPPPADRFKTPILTTRRNLQGLTTITPKVGKSANLSIMRRPQNGEVAFSTSGSPLLIGAVSVEDIPTVSVPLPDGRVFSILPEDGAPPDDLPEFDEETKRYLKTLREHLEILAPSRP